MSTRSNVAVEDPNTKEIKVIYVHSDGYPDGVGDVLLKHYNDYDSASMLVNKGSASYIAETLDECNFYETKEDSFVKHNNEYCWMYDMRGEIMIEYLYLFKNNKWYVSEMKTMKRKPKDKLIYIYGDEMNDVWEHFNMSVRDDDDRIVLKFVRYESRDSYKK